MTDANKRFDEEAARRILRRAAEEQVLREGDEDHSYTLQQLLDIAAEAGISPEAIRAAAMEYEASLTPATSEPGVAEGAEEGGWITTLERRLPESWSRRRKRAVSVAAGLGLLGLLISVVGPAPVAFALSLVILMALLLLLLGLGPF